MVRLKLLLGSSALMFAGTALAMDSPPDPSYPSGPGGTNLFNFTIGATYGGPTLTLEDNGNITYDTGGLALGMLTLGATPALDVQHTIMIGDPALGWDDQVGNIPIVLYGYDGNTVELNDDARIAQALLDFMGGDGGTASQLYGIDVGDSGSPPLDLGANVAILADHRRRFGQDGDSRVDRAPRKREANGGINPFGAVAHNDNNYVAERIYANDRRR